MIGTPSPPASKRPCSPPPFEPLTTGASLPLVLLFFCLLAPGPRAQDPAAREDPTGGVLVTLPEGWRWEGGDLQAVRRMGSTRLQVLLESFPGHYPLDHIAGYRSRSSVADLRVESDVSFGSLRHAVSISFEDGVKMGGSKERRRKVQVFLFKHAGTLHRWTETVMKPVPADAPAAFESLRKAVKVKRPPGWSPPDKKRRYPNQRITYKLPRGWSWLRGRKGPKVKIPKRNPTSRSPLPELFAVRRDILEKKRLGALICALTAGATPTSPKDQARFAEKNVGSQFEQVRDLAYEELNFKGRKAALISFSAVAKGSSRRFWRRTIFFKSKGILVLWTEISYGRPLEEFKREIKQARAGLKFG